MRVEEYVGTHSKHWECDRVEAYIFTDIFDAKFVNDLERCIVNLLDRKSLTYLTHRTTFSFENQNKRIISHKQNNREQQVIYDLTFQKEWWHQTKDTIKSWADSYIPLHINPVFYKYLKFFENQLPIASEPNRWIPFRMHMNLLEYSNFLGIHSDMNDQYFKTESKGQARARSVTFYFEDHVLGQGGEFWGEEGFVYKPKRNSALSINGNSNLHGVAANMAPDKKPRMAFTTRWAHIDDLYLPGHPDKALWKLEF
jgi:hypothetical protein